METKLPSVDEYDCDYTLTDDEYEEFSKSLDEMIAFGSITNITIKHVISKDMEYINSYDIIAWYENGEKCAIRIHIGYFSYLNTLLVEKNIWKNDVVVFVHRLLDQIHRNNSVCIYPMERKNTSNINGE